MTTVTFIGLDALRWLAAVTAVLTAAVLFDAFAGHYRRAFASRLQYLPFAVGVPLAVVAAANSLHPSSWAKSLAGILGALALATGMAGFVVHHVFGIARAPGGYGLLRHHLMYGPPPLAPLALSLCGWLAVLGARPRPGLRGLLLATCAAGLAGSAAQSWLLHHRGAFNDRLMYVPLTVPVAAAALCVTVAASPDGLAQRILPVFLWATFLAGFLGLGMHLRGMDRQMGGLYVARFNWLQGPPALAPLVFSALAAVGLLALALLP